MSTKKYKDHPSQVVFCPVCGREDKGGMDKHMRVHGPEVYTKWTRDGSPRALFPPDKLDTCCCCGGEMIPRGFGDCNGWECRDCEHREYDVLSFKMNNPEY